MFRYSILFFCLGILGYVIGATEVAGFSLELGRVLMAGFLIFTILSGMTAMAARQNFEDRFRD